MHNWNAKKKRKVKMGQKKIFQMIMTENFPKINVRHETPGSENTENINRINVKRNNTKHIIFITED